MELKDTGIITVDKNAKQKIKCKKFFCKTIDRHLMVHESVENKNISSVSDSITGYRLFNIEHKINLVTPEMIKEKLKNFVKHFTVEGIAEEFKRIENLPQDNGKKRK